ncbi:hypothetical protein HY629_02585 [Candidatus Uhrbacteria bacterium]|nr:hypothetical protein [Candidatus Uhrbacteria bacterium]
MKRPITHRALLTLLFSGRPILRPRTNTLDQFTLAAPVVLPDGMLVRSDAGGGVAVIDGGLRRHIVSPDVFKSRGYQWQNVKVVPDRILALHKEGEPIEF